MQLLKGICVPTCTTFTEDGSQIDTAAFTGHLDRLLEAGIPLIAINGGTGEFPFLSHDEKIKLAELAIEHVNGQAKIIIHTSSTRTEESIELSRHAEKAGADAVLLLPPYFEGPNEEGVFEHYKRVSDAVSIPIMAYNIPVYSGFDITAEFFSRLMTLENVRYIKDSTGDMLRIYQLLGVGALVFNGADQTILESMMLECAGSFWGGANIFPAEAVKLNKLIDEKHYSDALALWKKLVPVCVYLWTVSFNPGVKTATNLMGGNVGECRRPVQPLTAAQLEKLKTAMSPLL